MALICKDCGVILSINYDEDYCPNCGSDMLSAYALDRRHVVGRALIAPFRIIATIVEFAAVASPVIAIIVGLLTGSIAWGFATLGILIGLRLALMIVSYPLTKYVKYLYSDDDILRMKG